MNSLLEPLVSRSGERGVYAREPLGPQLPRLAPEVPVLLLFGDNDWLANPRHAEVAAGVRAVPGGVCELDVVPHAGHHLYLDNPDFFNERVQRFVEEHVVDDDGSDGLLID